MASVSEMMRRHSTASTRADGLAPALEHGILITIHRLSYGGADRVAVLLANGLAEAGIPVGFAILRGGGEGEASLFELLRDDVRRWTAGPPMGSRHLELVRGLGFIRRLISNERPSLVLASSNNMGLVTGFAARMGTTGVRPAYAMKTTNPVIRPCDRSAIRKEYRRRLYRFVFSPYDRILNLTFDERQTLERMCPDMKSKFAVVANPYVSPEMLAGGHSQPSGRPRILTAARMMPQKRLDVLLKAFARMERRDCRLIILGEGPERPRLEALAAALGIEDRIDLPGFADSIIPWLSRASLFALSSDYEGLPAAIFEAFACKVPVVMTDCFEGARSLLANAPRSSVVPVGDFRALARAMDDSLEGKAPLTSLRQLARGYEVNTAIASHLGELEPFLHARRATGN